MKISSNGLALTQLIWGPIACIGILLAGDWVASLQSQVVSATYLFASVYVVMAPAIYRAFFWSGIMSVPLAPSIDAQKFLGVSDLADVPAAPVAKAETDQMTERKTADVMQRGYRKVGYVLQKSGGDYVLVAQGAVRWMSQQRNWQLMHEQDGAALARPAADHINDVVEMVRARARITELESSNTLLANLWTAVTEHIAMFEGTSDEFNMTATAIQQALAALLADSAGTPAAPAGEVVVTKHPDGRILRVTRQATDGQVLSVLSSAGEDDGTRMAAAAQAAEAEHRHESASVLRGALALQPMVEPVTINKALLAHRPAQVVLASGVGPVAAVHLVNIGLTGWVHTEATAKAYADGYNTGQRQLRNALHAAALPQIQTEQESHQ